MNSDKKLALWVGSSPAPFDTFQLGLEKLKKEKINFTIAKEVKEIACKKESLDRPFLAGADEIKIHSFVQLWNDDDVRNILGVRGGYGTLRLLSKLDNAKLKRRGEKMLWGFSDFTILQNYLYNRLKRPWVHSPFLTSRSFFEPNNFEKSKFLFHENSLNSESFSDFKLRVLVGNQKTMKKVVHKKAPIIGGNLACLASMMGTPWEPTIRVPHHLFIEDVNEKPYRIDRLLHQIMNANFFKHTLSIILGYFEEKDGEKVFNVIKKWAEENNLFVLKGLPAGHDVPNVPMILGSPVEFLALDKESLLLRIQKPIL